MRRLWRPSALFSHFFSPPQLSCVQSSQTPATVLHKLNIRFDCSQLLEGGCTRKSRLWGARRGKCSCEGVCRDKASCQRAYIWKASCEGACRGKFSWESAKETPLVKERAKEKPLVEEVASESLL